MEQQVRRMLKDGRMRGMAEEFGARWLGVRISLPTMAET